MLEKKIVQVVHYVKEKDFLKYRLQSYPEIDTFLIVESFFDLDGNQKTEMLQIDDVVSETNSEIIHLNFNENKPKDRKEYYDNLFLVVERTLKVICKNFEDIIFFSEENEFSDFEDLEIIKKKLSFEPFLLRHNSFWWNKNLVSPIKELGSIVFLFSNVLVNRKFFNSLLNQKTFKSNFFDGFLDNGWKFNYFNNRPIGYEKYEENLLVFGNLPIKLKKFVGGDKQPKNFEFFGDIENLNKDLIQNQIEIHISFDNTVPEILFETEDFNIFRYNLHIPNKSYYGDSSFDEFIQEFKKNEIKRILKDFIPYDENYIRIFTKDSN